MSAVPTAKGRRIDDILLELGFATEAALAKARVEHEKTGQPLGTILVEQGAITRLELASALAEQWSDQSASIKLLPIPSPASVPRQAPEPHDDDQYAARLQDAVAELAQRVGATQPREEFDDRVTDLAERVEATVARTQRIEVTLATLAESFEGVTGGVEEAFGALQSGMAGLALDLARIDTTVAEMASQGPEASGIDPELATRLEELGTAVAALADRPVADPAIGSRLDALAAHIERLDEADDLRPFLAAVEQRVAELAELPVADPTEIEGRLDALTTRLENAVAPDEVGALRDSLVALEQRLSLLAEDVGATDALDDQARSLAELREAVGELESRPVGDPELDERLARIETEFADRLAAKPDAREIEALAARLEASANDHEGLATAVAQLGVRIDEMTWRDEGATTGIEELQARVEAVTATLADVRQGLATQEEAGAPRRLDELGDALGAVRDEVAALAQSVPPADRIEQIAQRIEDLTGERDAQQALAARLEELERRLTADVVTPEDLSRALSGARDELTPAPSPLPDPRVDELAREVAALRDGNAPDPRLDELADELTEVRARLAEVRVAPEPGDEIGAELAAELASLRQELADVRSSSAPGDDSGIRAEVEALGRRIEEVTATTTTDPLVATELDTLSARLRAMESRVEGDLATGGEVTQAIEALRAEVAGARTPIVMDTSELEGTIEALVARVDALAGAVASGTPDAAAPAAEEVQRLIDERVETQVAGRVAELTRVLEERLAAAGAEAQSRAGGAPTGDAGALDELLESNRMTIERLGLHLGEHDRALAELMRSRNLPQKLDELAARVEEIAVGAPPTAAPAAAPGTRREIGGFGSGESTGDVRALMRRVEDAEVASQADREKLMNRLERMASSIDWRLQRLESTDGQE